MFQASTLCKCSKYVQTTNAKFASAKNSRTNAKYSLQKVIQQVNTAYGSKSSHDTVELSQNALDLLNTSKTKTADETKKTEAAMSHQKYPTGMFTAEEWAENSILEQRSGIQTVSDVIDHAKSKLKYTMSKIDELENYLNGTGTHSDPNMTAELGEAYLHHYKQSIQSDYTDLIQSHINPHRSIVDEYEELSGGLASEVIGNQLNSISAESLGLSNLSDDSQKIMEALENASKILNCNTDLFRFTCSRTCPPHTRSRVSCRFELWTNFHRNCTGLATD